MLETWPHELPLISNNAFMSLWSTSSDPNSSGLLGGELLWNSIGFLQKTCVVGGLQFELETLSSGECCFTFARHFVLSSFLWRGAGFAYSSSCRSQTKSQFSKFLLQGKITEWERKRFFFAWTTSL